MNFIAATAMLVAAPTRFDTKTGVAICNVRVAIRSRSGNKTSFIDCKAFDKRAETILAMNLQKGTQILIEDGELQEDTWTSSEGQKRSKHTIVIQKIYALKGGNNDRTEAPEDVTRVF